MKRKEFYQLTEKKVVILDGAFGTWLQKKGMPSGICPEKWVLENEQILIDLQKGYAAAGSEIIYSCTFGLNFFKLQEFGLENEVFDLNRKLVNVTRKAVKNNCYIAGDISSTGKFVNPFGEIELEEMINVFKEQVKGLLAGGVDLFAIETIMDIQEARAALIAVKELSDLPVIVSMTYTETGHTLTGTDPVSALVTLQGLGADAVGVNCSTGPEKMVPLLSAMKPYAKVPLFAKPNAGVPKLVDGKTVFNLSPQEFSKHIPALVKAGANMVGGCCGTDPEYLELVNKKLKKIKPEKYTVNSAGIVCSSKKVQVISPEQGLIIVGERINPTGKKILQEELKNGEFNEVRKFIKEQETKGAQILDINVGMPVIDEKKTMLKVIETASNLTALPLCIDTSNIDTMESALRYYPGRALINSISAEKHKLEKLLPIATKYGAMFILLPLDDACIPEKAEGRIKIIDLVYTEARKYGFTKADIIVDGLVMAISSNQAAALETLKVIEYCSGNGFNTIVGLSNISFGMPDREKINAAFLSAAAFNGLSAAIVNPSHELLVSIKMAMDVILLKDKNSRKYIEYVTRGTAGDPGSHKIPVTEMGKPDDQALLFQAVLEGDKNNIISICKRMLENNILPDHMMEKILIPAIQKVGDYFDQKKFFLPQLILSAETMKLAFEFLTPFLQKDTALQKKKKILLATVQGDVHDIGKNIVGLMLKNYGFEVYDLGKNISAEKIIEQAQKQKVDIIGLSALMTTTMPEMKHIITIAREKGLATPFMIGGAVVTDGYAQEIGAFYAKDSISAVRLAEKL